MSSDLFVFDSSGYRHSGSEMISSDVDLQFYFDCFPPFPDSPPPIDILQAISDDSNLQKPIDGTPPTLLSSSPPNLQMQNLSLTHLQHLADASKSSNGFSDFSPFEVKIEESHVRFDSSSSSFSYGGTGNVAKIMQRSYSSNSFEGKPGFFLQPRFDTLMESPNFQTHVKSSPENCFPTNHMRRVCSTGDLQKPKATTQTTPRFSSSPLSTERSFMEEANFKVVRYSAEERKERIHRYRAKRTQRNFNKTIKYACRKTLADNRPRIRGRFARNDETVEIPKATSLNRYEDEEELWIDGLHEEDDGAVSAGSFFNGFGPTQFQYCGF